MPERHWLIERLRGWGERPALTWRDQTWSYDELCDATDVWLDKLAHHHIASGDTLAIRGD